MSYEELFTRYGCRSDAGRVEIRGYFIRPDKLTIDRIGHYDKSAAWAIQEAQSAIDQLTAYRKGLADRYNQLTTAPYKLRLEFERHRQYKGNVFYYIRIVRTYEDGTKVDELSETYKGSERRAAFARFEELKKQRPGIEIMVDIEKARWEL